MSVLTPCNYCSLQIIKKAANRLNQKVTVVSNANWGMGGVNVYVHPPEVNVKNIKEDSEEHKKYCRSWYMSLTDHCVC